MQVLFNNFGDSSLDFIFQAHVEKIKDLVRSLIGFLQLLTDNTAPATERKKLSLQEPLQNPSVDFS